MSPRFHLFVSDVIQGNEVVGWVRDFLAWPQGWKKIFDKLLKMLWDVRV